MLMPDPEKKDKVVAAFVELTAAKPVLPQRFRPPAAEDKKDDKKDDKKPDPAPDKNQ
jgi:hypothetical protein